MTTADPREPSRAAGIGLRASHHAAVMASPPAVGWLEIHAENYLGGGQPRRCLEIVRRDRAVSVHGVGLSLGSADGLDETHLARVAALVGEIEPFLVSEHLAWSVTGGVYHNDLLPLPYTEESLAVVAANILRLQERLQRRVLIENPSTYLRFAHSPIPEAEFLAALAARTGCGMLLDVNNVQVCAVNHGFEAAAYIDAVPAGTVGEIHLAGHHAAEEDGIAILIDDHGSAVPETVWRLYRQAVRRFPEAPTLIEWDTRIPALDVLVAEAQQADARRAAALAGMRHAVAA
ncbi:MAG: DUF692 domain-containing protein [Alphaproteobacteria bacterium]|nr:DUF692 domain-containing protein [Alphaproteobacteria bacterium]